MKLTGEAKFLLGVAVATAIIIGGSFLLFSRPEPPQEKLDRSELVGEDSYTIGNASASAYLVEFSDYQCPACKVFSQTVDELVDRYQDRMLFVYRDFPLDQHPYSMPTALAAGAAARQGKFREMNLLLYKNQERFSESLWSELAETIGLDAARFEEDMKSPELKNHIERDRAAAIKLGINATPTFYLNGEKLVLLGPADLITAVEAVFK